MSYKPAVDRYEAVTPGWFRRCGRSGLMLPAISLGMWHNFGEQADDPTTRRMCYDAFDRGITHFDLANNYGPPPGSAEQRVGRILQSMPRDELIISTKAGWPMWPGPYGNFGSRKYLLASLDQSLKRLGLDYVDIFYHHRPDPDTPMEESLGALDHAVRSGKALYAGISSHNAKQTKQAAKLIEQHNLTPLLIHQPSYNMLDRWIEDGLLDVSEKKGMGIIAFCPLAQGLLTNRYLEDIPSDSRVASVSPFLTADKITPDLRRKLQQLNEVAHQRGQSLAQMALSWVLRDERVTSALIGASRPEQIHQNVQAAHQVSFTAAELARIDAIIAG